MLTIGVLISGKGSNLQAIIDAVGRGEITGRVAVVISNKADAYGLERARKAGIEALVIPSRGKERTDFEREVAEALESRGVELVCLAGFMRVLTPYFIRRFKHRIMNIHPALLPSFPGEDAQGQAFAYGVKVTGCTVHFVDEGVDTGPVIVQIPVEVREDDTADTLSGRILEQEHRAFPRAIQLFAEGRLQVTGRKARVLPARR
ncbi:MAG: phosphoribosylglycinamide formyltransferase [Euryarchaeota archaeon]|nr:phosphoribosylglycinamide formyltransferase [Euryarchaeota archaeon]